MSHHASICIFEWSAGAIKLFSDSSHQHCVCSRAGVIFQEMAWLPGWEKSMVALEKLLVKFQDNLDQLRAGQEEKDAKAEPPLHR
ncbi:MAG: hypothetical protein GY792_36310 [Gammaproteobacteria bacterium]|nr:hypothetical protein [Gammaproteobacteria bacterium]